MFKKIKKAFNKKEKSSAKGVHYFTFYDGLNPLVKSVTDKIEGLRVERDRMIKDSLATESYLKKHYIKYKNLMKSIEPFQTRQVVVHNLVTTEGFNVLARILAGDNTYTGNINYTALGTNNASPVLGDTQLGTEVYRKAVSSASFIGSKANIETFYTATEVNGSFEEYGNFIDGGVAPNTGRLFNRFTQTLIKSSTETLNVRSEITFSNA